jgi:hypothetical protein
MAIGILKRWKTMSGLKIPIFLSREVVSTEVLLDTNSPIGYITIIKMKSETQEITRIPEFDEFLIYWRELLRRGDNMIVLQIVKV